jgi:hypothetical protein
MVKAQSRTLIYRPLPDVYGFVVEDFVRNHPRWSPEVQHLRPLTDGPLDLEWTAHQVRVDQGRRTETDFRVIALDPQHIGPADLLSRRAIRRNGTDRRSD